MPANAEGRSSSESITRVSDRDEAPARPALAHRLRPAHRSRSRATTRGVSFTQRLTHWVDSPDRDPLEGCELRYRPTESGSGPAQLLVRNQDRFVELLLQDTGEGQYATGKRGQPGSGGYFHLEDESAVDDILETLEREVRSWRQRA